MIWDLEMFGIGNGLCKKLGDEYGDHNNIVDIDRMLFSSQR